MPETDETDERVHAIDLGLEWDIGAPLPHLLQSEYRTFLTFYLADPPAGWDGTFVRIVDPVSEQPAHIGIVEWLRCHGATLGGANDEAYHGHRLWGVGLSNVGAYRAGEVVGSRWIRELERANRVHSRHDPEPYLSFRHFILGFHDSTFECVALGFRAWTTFAPMPEVIATLAGLLDADDEPPFAEVQAS